MWEYRNKGVICKSGTGPLPDVESGYLDLRFPSLQNWKINVCCLSHWSMIFLLSQPKWTKTWPNHNTLHRLSEVSTILISTLVTPLHFNSLTIIYNFLGFPGGTSGKEHACQCRRHKRLGFDPLVGKIPWRRAWQPTPVFLPGESPWTEEPVRLQSMGSQSWTWLSD